MKGACLENRYSITQPILHAIALFFVIALLFCSRGKQCAQHYCTAEYKTV